MGLRTNEIQFSVVTTTERDALVTPSGGLTIYNSTTGQLETNDGTPGAPVWNPAGSSTISPNTQSAIEASKQTIGAAIIPPVISSNQNDYAPTGIANTVVMFLEASVNVDITGIQAPVVDGTILKIQVKEGSSNIKLKKQNTSSSAANRFAFNADKNLQETHGAELVYYLAEARWYLNSINN